MKRLPALVLVLTLATGVAGGWFGCLHHFGGPEEPTTELASSLDSKLLGERRDYLVRLPDSYARERTRRYPVVYVLDGGSQIGHTSDSAALLARIGAMPEAIVVGVPSLDNEHRQRDYTPPRMRQDAERSAGPEGHADRFLAFLRSELMPDVQRRYRTAPQRVLAGWSRGGLFVVYTLSTDPALFQGYIANSPALWRDDGEMVKRLQRFLRSRPQVSARLFLSLGGAENDKMRGAYNASLRVLRADAPESLHWYTRITPGADHSANAALATPVGLRWVFDANWAPDQNGMSSSGKGSSWRLPGEATALAGAREAPP